MSRQEPTEKEINAWLRDGLGYLHAIKRALENPAAEGIELRLATLENTETVLRNANHELQVQVDDLGAALILIREAFHAYDTGDLGIRAFLNKIAEALSAAE